jgi:2-keto-4-pentenoate hydratase
MEPMADPFLPSLETLSLIAEELFVAERQRAPVGPVSERYANFDVACAYRVQSMNIGKRVAGGAVLVGHKVGLTNMAMQAQLGVDEPDFGALLDDMKLEADDELSLAEFISARIEPEIAFVLSRDLAGPGMTSAEVLAATQAVAPALEIIDSRIANWRIKLVDTVADNASSARVVVGPLHSVRDLDLVSIEGRLERDGEVVGSGQGAAVLGDPAAAVAWLVNTLASFGECVRAGEVVIPGALCASVPLTVGSHFRTEIAGLGGVGIRVTA